MLKKADNLSSNSKLTLLHEAGSRSPVHPSRRLQILDSPSWCSSLGGVVNQKMTWTARSATCKTTSSGTSGLLFTIMTCTWWHGKHNTYKDIKVEIKSWDRMTVTYIWYSIAHQFIETQKCEWIRKCQSLITWHCNLEYKLNKLRKTSYPQWANEGCASIYSATSCREITVTCPAYDIEQK